MTTNISVIHESVFLLYETMYNDNKYLLSLYKTMYNENIYLSLYKRVYNDK